MDDITRFLQRAAFGDIQRNTKVTRPLMSRASRITSAVSRYRWRSTSGRPREGWTFWRARYDAPRRRGRESEKFSSRPRSVKSRGDRVRLPRLREAAGRGADGRGLLWLVAELTQPELRQEVLKLRRRVRSSRRCCGSRRPYSNLRVSPHRCASAGRTRQAADPHRGGLGPANTFRCARSCGSARLARGKLRLPWRTSTSSGAGSASAAETARNRGCRVIVGPLNDYRNDRRVRVWNFDTYGFDNSYYYLSFYLDSTLLSTDRAVIGGRVMATDQGMTSAPVEVSRWGNLTGTEIQVFQADSVTAQFGTSYVSCRSFSRQTCRQPHQSSAAP